jgi:RNA polymerase sigma-70 factor, ECF subfamily
MPVGSGPDVTGRVPGACPGGARDIELSLTDRDRFGAVFDRYFAEIHGYAARRAGRDAADDIAAET